MRPSPPFSVTRGSMTDQKKDILLSICLNGRNDNYGGRFKQRLEQSINYLAAQAERIKRLQDIEVVLTDWNSDVPLSDVLQLSAVAAEITRVIIVPPEIAKPHNHPGTAFHTTMSLNVGIRRSKGSYVCVMPGDVLIPQFALSQLLNLLDGKLDPPFDVPRSVMLVPRKLLPCEFDVTTNKLSDLDRNLLLIDSNLPLDPQHVGEVGGSGAIIVHSDMLRRFHGFNERLGGWGRSDVDFGIKANVDCPTISLSFYGITMYDFQLPARTLVEKFSRANDVSHFEFLPNNPQWGLPETVFQERKVVAAVPLRLATLST